MRRANGLVFAGLALALATLFEVALEMPDEAEAAYRRVLIADAADPLFASLDDKQKVIFIQEMVRLSHERGLD